MSTAARPHGDYITLANKVRELSRVLSPKGDAEIDQRLADIEGRIRTAGRGFVTIEVVDLAWLNDTLADFLNSGLPAQPEQMT